MNELIAVEMLTYGQPGLSIIGLEIFHRLYLHINKKILLIPPPPIINTNEHRS